MCGIAGFLTSPGNFSADTLSQVVATMTNTQTHRGPDDEGTWCDAAAAIALGHRRLSILDLSEQGHQPILSSCGRFVLVYNGEIYNFHELRKELEQAGRKFRGHSDTEVLCEAISCWGLNEALPKLRGMFAFAVWNRMERQLTLVRDRVGIKPLYFGQFGRTLMFGSELKALRAHPYFEAEVDPAAVGLQLRHNYIPAPYSIYKNVRKLPAGCLVQIHFNDDEGQLNVGDIEPWWSLTDVIEQGRSNPFSGSFDEAVDEFDRLAKESVALRMLADVKVGAFLSGGLDSSLVVALMQEQSSRPVRTFTIGFTEFEYDEAPYARRISEHLGTEHTELCVMPSEAQSVIPKLQQMYDEPFSDMSQIPTYLVSRLARRDVTVSLSGDGGDELFGGYNRYFHLANIWNQLNRVPGRHSLASALRWYAGNSPVRFKKASCGHYADLLDTASADQLYAKLHRHWLPSEVLNVDCLEPSSQLGFGKAIAGLEDPQLSWMALDTLTYLPEDILTKVDRASMAVSLEVRVPLLDHNVVEFAWSLPKEYRFEPNQGKKLLRNTLGRHLPLSYFDRPKVGFGIPIGEWLRGSLYDWAEDLLSEERLNAHGMLRTDVIRQRWEDHVAGKTNWQYPLWDVLMFQAWLVENHQ